MSLVYLSTRRIPTTVARRWVWHAGYLQTQEADDLAAAIETRQKLLEQAKFHQCMGTKEQLASVDQQQAELQDLLGQYQALTGEPYERKDRPASIADNFGNITKLKISK